MGDELGDDRQQSGNSNHEGRRTLAATTEDNGNDDSGNDEGNKETETDKKTSQSNDCATRSESTPCTNTNCGKPWIHKR